MQLTVAGPQMIFEDNNHNFTITKADSCLGIQNADSLMTAQFLTCQTYEFEGLNY